MKKVALGLFALAMVLALARPAIATSITGQAAIGGTDTFSPTGVNFHNPGVIFMESRSLLSMSSVPTVTLNNITFSTAVGELLFDWNHGGTDITMTILSLTVDHNSSTFLNVNGTAMLTESGFSPTHYEWSLTSTTTGLTDYALTISPVPEPGSLLLVGSGLLGLAGFLFRKARKPVSTLPC